MNRLNRRTVELMAMVVVGWYLMIPPPRQIDDQFQINFSAPIEKWAQLRSFKRESECEAARTAYAKNPPGGVVDMLSSVKQARAAMQAAQCVSTDDRRLNEH